MGSPFDRRLHSAARRGRRARRTPCPFDDTTGRVRGEVDNRGYHHGMQWWNDFVDWLTSPAARPAIFYAAVLAVAVIVSGLISAWIARGALKGLLSRTDRQQKASAIAA